MFCACTLSLTHSLHVPRRPPFRCPWCRPLVRTAPRACPPCARSFLPACIPPPFLARLLVPTVLLLCCCSCCACSCTLVLLSSALHHLLVLFLRLLRAALVRSPLRSLSVAFLPPAVPPPARPLPPSSCLPWSPSCGRVLSLLPSSDCLIPPPCPCPPGVLPSRAALEASRSHTALTLASDHAFWSYSKPQVTGARTTSSRCGSRRLSIVNIYPYRAHTAEEPVGDGPRGRCSGIVNPGVLSNTSVGKGLKSSFAFRKPAMAVVSRHPARTKGL